jgi:hypothetical protein
MAGVKYANGFCCLICCSNLICVEDGGRPTMVFYFGVSFSIRNEKCDIGMLPKYCILHAFLTAQLNGRYITEQKSHIKRSYNLDHSNIYRYVSISTLTSRSRIRQKIGKYLLPGSCVQFFSLSGSFSWWHIILCYANDFS